MLALAASALPVSAQSADARPEAAGFVESGGRLVYFRVVRDSVVVFGQGAEGRPAVTLPYAAFVDALDRASRAGALDVSALSGPTSAPFALDVDDRAVVRLATAVTAHQVVFHRAFRLDDWCLVDPKPAHSHQTNNTATVFSWILSRNSLHRDKKKRA